MRISDSVLATHGIDCLAISNSTIHVVESLVFGGSGQSFLGGLCSTCCIPGDGFAGLAATLSSRVLLESSRVRGGLPDFFSYCGPAVMGPGVAVDSSSVVRFRGASLPSTAGGSRIQLVEPYRALAVAPAVVERSHASLEVRASPGGMAVLLLGDQAATTDLGGEVGMVHVANTTARRLLGQVPPSGVLTVDLLTPDVGSGEARPFLLQVALLTPAGVRFTAARSVHVTDSAVPPWN